MATAAGNGNALWRVVHDLCVPNDRLTGHAAPCAKVDLGRGYAVLNDPQNSTQLVLVPTARITGIEDPKLLERDTPNYWALAWDNRALLDRRARRSLPREQIGLVVNSAYARTQNQLHIHIDCVRADVARAASHADEIRSTWRPFPPRLVGHRYLARWIPDGELRSQDPFRLLTPIDTDRARQTLILIGATSPNRGAGFVLLNDQADQEAGDTGHGEDLLDHACRGEDSAGS